MTIVGLLATMAAIVIVAFNAVFTGVTPKKVKRTSKKIRKVMK